MTSEMRPAEKKPVPPRIFDFNIVVIFICGLILTSPCLIYGFPFYGDDSVSNALYSTEFVRQFWSGDLYPRWLQGMNGGLGSAVTFYYPPFAYWTISLLKLFFANDPDGWYQLGLSAALAVIASGAAVYIWLSGTVERRAALIASLVYLILPYHISLDLYARGALAELWTFVWMPLVLWAVDGLFARRRFALLGLALSYALLVLTHLPTTLIFSLIPLGYSLYLAPEREKLRAFVLTIAGMVLGVGLSAIYLVPAMTMQQFVFHTTEGIAGHYYFGNWFLFSNVKWFGSRSEYFMAAAQVIGMAFLAFLISCFLQKQSLKKKAVFWFAVALLAFFMMTPPSKGVWQLFPTLQKVQFPFRFNTALSLAAAPLTAFVFVNTRSRKRWLILIVAFLLFTGTWVYTTVWRAYFAYPAHYVDQAILDYATERQQQRRETDEFRPRWVVSIEPTELDTLLLRIGRTEGELSKVNVLKGQGTVVVKEWRPSQMVLLVDFREPATLNLSRFYFPGWFVRTDDSPDLRPVEPSKPGGLIRLDVPSGQHRLTLQLGKRNPEVAGQTISGLSLLIWLALLWWLALRHQIRIHSTLN